jgi:K+-transporting ATPase A subunit
MLGGSEILNTLRDLTGNIITLALVRTLRNNTNEEIGNYHQLK